MLNIFRRSLRTGITTTSYPEVEQPAPSAYRGMIALSVRDCTGDSACVNACPGQALRIEHTSDGGWIWRLDNGKCNFCGLCAEACDNGAIRITNEFELAVRDPDDFITEVRFKPGAGATREESESR